MKHINFAPHLEKKKAEIMRQFHAAEAVGAGVRADDSAESRADSMVDIRADFRADSAADSAVHSVANSVAISVPSPELAKPSPKSSAAPSARPVSPYPAMDSAHLPDSHADSAHSRANSMPDSADSPDSANVAAPYTPSAADLKARVVEALKTIYDPEIPVNIYDLGLIYQVAIDENNFASIDMTLTSPGCPVAQTFPGMVEGAVRLVPGISGAAVDLVWEPPWTQTLINEAARLELGLL